MSWLQISVSTNKTSCELTEEALLNCGACSVTLKDAADEPILDPAPGETPVWQNTLVTGLFENTQNTEALVSRIKGASINCLCPLFENQYRAVLDSSCYPEQFLSVIYREERAVNISRYCLKPSFSRFSIGIKRNDAELIQ